MKRRLLAYILLLVLALSGCDNPANHGMQPVEKSGAVLISLHPQIKLDYDREGLVMDVVGLNDEGKFISSNENDLVGLPCKIALQVLIKDIYDAGFFDSNVGGPEKEIFLTLEEGSVYHQGFLRALEKSVNKAAAECGLETITASIDEDVLSRDALIDHQLVEDLVLHQLHLPSAKFIK